MFDFWSMIFEFWYGLIVDLQSVFLSVSDVNFLDNWVVFNVNLLDLIPQILTVLTFVFLLIISYKVFKRIFYLFVSFWR